MRLDRYPAIVAFIRTHPVGFQILGQGIGGGTGALLGYGVCAVLSLPLEAAILPTVIGLFVAGLVTSDAVRKYADED